MTRDYAASGLVLAACVLALIGCGNSSDQPLPGAQEAAISLPGDRPPPPGVEDGVELVLKLEGIGSKAELDGALEGLAGSGFEEDFELGFRSCFVLDKSKRAYGQAASSMEKILAEHPDFAPAYRVLAYARFNLSFDMEGATELYTKAVEADPDYGEAHYALSFMLTQFDMVKARKHFDRSMELGIADERSLKEKFFQD